MEGRVVLTCAECGRTREIAGEIPEEYSSAFDRAVREEGWVPRPGRDHDLLCGMCLMNYAGHETVDDEEKLVRTPAK